MPLPLSSDAQALKAILTSSAMPKATLGRLSHLSGGRLTAALQELVAAGAAHSTRSLPEGIEMWRLVTTSEAIDNARASQLAAAVATTKASEPEATLRRIVTVFEELLPKAEDAFTQAILGGQLDTLREALGFHAEHTPAADAPGTVRLMYNAGRANARAWVQAIRDYGPNDSALVPSVKGGAA